MPRFFAIVDEQLDEPTRRRLMAANGKACFVARHPEQPRRPEPASREKIAQWVNEHGKDRGYSMDGDALILTYVGGPGQEWPANMCGCPTAEA